MKLKEILNKNNWENLLNYLKDNDSLMSKVIDIGKLKDLANKMLEKIKDKSPNLYNQYKEDPNKKFEAFIDIMMDTIKSNKNPEKYLFDIISDYDESFKKEISTYRKYLISNDASNADKKSYLDKWKDNILKTKI